MASLQELLSSSRQIIVGTTAGGAVNSRISISANNKQTITATAFTNIRQGQCVAILTDKGEWVAFQDSPNTIIRSTIEVNDLPRSRQQADQRQYVYLLGVKQDKQVYYAITNVDSKRIIGLYDYEDGRGDVKISFAENEKTWTIAGWQKFVDSEDDNRDKVRLQFVTEEEVDAALEKEANNDPDIPEFIGTTYTYDTFVEDTDDGEIRHYPYCCAHNGRWVVIETGYCTIGNPPNKVKDTPTTVNMVSFYDGEAITVTAECNPCGTREYAQAKILHIVYQSYYTGKSDISTRINLREYTHSESFFLAHDADKVHTNTIVVREVLGESGTHSQFSSGRTAGRDGSDRGGYYSDEFGSQNDPGFNYGLPLYEPLHPRNRHKISGLTLFPIIGAELDGTDQKANLTTINISTPRTYFQIIKYELYSSTILITRPNFNDDTQESITHRYSVVVDANKFNSTAYVMFGNTIEDKPSAPVVMERVENAYWYTQDKVTSFGAFEDDTFGGGFPDIPGNLTGTFPSRVGAPFFFGGDLLENEDYAFTTDFNRGYYPMFNFVSRLKGDVNFVQSPFNTVSIVADKQTRTAGFLRSRRDELAQIGAGAGDNTFLSFEGAWYGYNPEIDRNSVIPRPENPRGKAVFWFHDLGGVFAASQSIQAFFYPVAAYKDRYYIIYQSDDDPAYVEYVIASRTFDAPPYRTRVSVPLTVPDKLNYLQYGEPVNDQLEQVSVPPINLGLITALRFNLSASAPFFRTPFKTEIGDYQTPLTIVNGVLIGAEFVTYPQTHTYHFAEIQRYATPDVCIDDQVLVHAQRNLFRTFIPSVIENDKPITAIDILLYDILSFKYEETFPAMMQEKVYVSEIGNYMMRMTDVQRQSPAYTPTKYIPFSADRSKDKFFNRNGLCFIKFWADHILNVPFEPINKNAGNDNLPPSFSYYVGRVYESPNQIAFYRPASDLAMNGIIKGEDSILAYNAPILNPTRKVSYSDDTSTISESDETFDEKVQEVPPVYDPMINTVKIISEHRKLPQNPIVPPSDGTLPVFYPMVIFTNHLPQPFSAVAGFHTEEIPDEIVGEDEYGYIYESYGQIGMGEVFSLNRYAVVYDTAPSPGAKIPGIKADLINEITEEIFESNSFSPSFMKNTVTKTKPNFTFNAQWFSRDPITGTKPRVYVTMSAPSIVPLPTIDMDTSLPANNRAGGDPSSNFVTISGLVQYDDLSERNRQYTRSTLLYGFTDNHRDFTLTSRYVFFDDPQQRKSLFYRVNLPNLPNRINYSTDQINYDWMTGFEQQNLGVLAGTISLDVTGPDINAPNFIPPFQLTRGFMANKDLPPRSLYSLETTFFAHPINDEKFVYEPKTLPIFNTNAISDINDLPDSAKLIWKDYSLRPK